MKQWILPAELADTHFLCWGRHYTCAASALFTLKNLLSYLSPILPFDTVLFWQHLKEFYYIFMFILNFCFLHLFLGF